MYFLQSEHNPPHIHAIYNDDVAAIYDGRSIGGASSGKSSGNGTGVDFPS